MPSGYTAPIAEKNLTFPQFAMLCARAFGACISMRDDPLDAPIPEKVEPMSTYHKEHIAKSEEELKTLLAIKTKKDKEAWAKRKLKREIATAKKYKEDDEKKNDMSKYKAMLEQVRDWTPPTTDHEDFKKFMIDQLDQTIRFDGSGSTYWSDQLESLKKKLDDPLAYFNEEVQKARDEVEYHKRHWAEDLARAENATRWLRNLRDSLKEEKVA